MIGKGILKRIETVENTLKVTHCPGLIMIRYDEQEKKYEIRENYMNGKGECIRRKIICVDQLHDYVFAPGVSGVCIMELFDAPVSNPNLYVLRVDEFRKEEKIEAGAGFRIFIDTDEDQ